MTHHWKARGKRWTWTDAATGGRRGQAIDIPDRVPELGGKGVSSGKVSRKVRDTDGDVGSLLEEERAVHSHHIGGGKSPPS